VRISLILFYIKTIINYYFIEFYALNNNLSKRSIKRKLQPRFPTIKKNTNVLKTSILVLNDIIRQENLMLSLYSFYKKDFEQAEKLIDVLEYENYLY